jgi:hypothetical protein
MRRASSVIRQAAFGHRLSGIGQSSKVFFLDR